MIENQESPVDAATRRAIEHRLRELLTQHAAINRALKQRLRATWTEPMADVQREYVRSRRRTTELCVARAHLRGRRHLERAPREGVYPGMKWDAERYHARVTERVIASLELPEVARGAA